MKGIRVGNMLGVPLHIDSSWLILFALILWSFTSAAFPSNAPGYSGTVYLVMGIAGTLLFFASLLAHELAHAVVARARGIPVDRITLFLFGGMAQTRTEAERPGDEFMIAAAGPAMSVLLAVLLFGAAELGAALGWSRALTVVARYLAGLNVILAVFNLLPGFPLDGGRIFRSAVWKATGSVETATRWAAQAGRWLGYGLIAFGALIAVDGSVISGMWLAFIGWFLRTAALDTLRNDSTSDDDMRRPEMLIPLDRLPPGFAERIDEPEEVAEPRPAATAVLVRDGAVAPEILLLKRHRAAGFVPGAWVFPGGRVDAADADRELVELLGQTPRGPEPAFWTAAIREVFEETGVLLARTAGGESCPDATRDPAMAAWRTRLLADEATLLDVLRALDARPDTSRMVYCSHWITPVAEPKRYDTRFFLAELPAGCVHSIDTREMSDAVWITCDAAIEAFRRGDLPMVFPTVKTIQRLAQYETVDEMLAAFREAEVPAILPRLVRTDEGVGIVVDE